MGCRAGDGDSVDMQASYAAPGGEGGGNALEGGSHYVRIGVLQAQTVSWWSGQRGM